MDYKNRILWMLIASAITTIVSYYLADTTVSLTMHLSDDRFSYSLMMLIGMIAAVAANLPSLLLLWWRKFPRAVAVGLFASAEAFILSYILIPMAVIVGFGNWAAMMFISVLASYALIDATLNQTRQSKRRKLISIVAIFVVTTTVLGLLLTA